MATRMGGTPAAITAARATEMAILPIQEWPNCKAALRGLGTIMVPLMESWDLGREARFAPTSATMDIQANLACHRFDELSVG